MIIDFTHILPRKPGSFRGCRDIYVLAAKTGFARLGA